MPTEADTEDLRLAEFRKARRLTQHDVSEQLIRLAWLRHRTHVGVNADMVSKWERGQKRPTMFYRELLCLLFQADSDQLGFSHLADQDQPRATPQTDADSSLTATLTGINSILDQLGPAGAMLQPKIFTVWKDELLKRRTLLKLISMVPAAVVLDPPIPTATVYMRAPINTLDDLSARYQQLYHSTKPAYLLALVLAHLETVTDVLRQTASIRERTQLHANQARTAMLAGRIEFFDLHDAINARGYYNLALEAAREAGDDLLAAAVLGHAAFIPAAEGRYAAAQDYVDGAGAYLRRSPHAAVESWIGAVETEISCEAGAERSAFAAADRSQDAFARTIGQRAPSWFDYYDSSRLDGFRGYAFLRFGRFDDARAALKSATAALPHEAIKQRAVFLTDLATLNIHAGELDEGCRAASDAAELLAQTDYATGTDRLRHFRGLVEPWKQHPAVKDLDAQLALT